jgi:hypothetical protein
MAQLAQAIRDAFPDGQPPERPITGHRCSECDEIDAIMGGRIWSEFADDFPWQCDVFALLNEAARVYYLPAYMLAAIGPQCGTQDVSIESALEDGRLDPKDFNAAQQKVIMRWAELHWKSIGEEPPQSLIVKWSV